jgi:hypothetical protein
MQLVPIATVEYLKTSRPFASNHDLGMAIAQLDLTNRPVLSQFKPECLN